MGEKAIRVAGLGKEYQIGTRERGYTTFREAVARAVSAPLRRLRRLSGVAEQGGSFWALKDVSFEVEPGEVVGIIGRNGAGKSTLLKVLSQITEPTEGEITLNGRVGSLLEVGTGFHPELTGRENIYLNGAILGMSRREVARKFDEIVAFSEVEQFLDTPVKRYSSGMYTRLAFSVAAHLEPEILIVDEVLAVGDAAFQKKCLGKMGDVAKGGRTVLFVSHNMNAVTRLCKQVVYLRDGQVCDIGPTDVVVLKYLRSSSTVAGERRWENRDDAPGRLVKLRGVRLLDREGHIGTRFDMRDPIRVELTIEVGEIVAQPRFSIRLLADDGVTVFTTADQDGEWQHDSKLNPGLYTVGCHIPGHLLNSGQFSITCGADIPFVKVLFFEESVLTFEVERTGGASGRFTERWPGVVCPRISWDRTSIATDGRTPGESARSGQGDSSALPSGFRGPA